MNKKAVQWLYQQLPDLVGKGVLSQEAADKLHVHYGEPKGVDKKWFVIVLCSILGAVLIGLGIMLLFAHNWEQLPRSLRAVLSLLPLLAGQVMAGWVLWKRPTSHAFKESSAIFLTLMVGASMALIGQTYNIPSTMGDFMLTWMLLTVPLVYLMEATVPAALYVLGITVWVGGAWGSPSHGILFWFLAGVVVPHFIWALRQEKYALRAAILTFVLAVCGCIGAGFGLRSALDGFWVLVYSSLTAVFYLLGSWPFRRISTNWQRPFSVVGGLGVSVLMFLLTFGFSWEFGRYQGYRELPSWIAWPDYVLTLAVLGSAVFMLFQYVRRRDWLRVSFGVFPLVALVGFVFAGATAVFSTFLFSIYMFCVSLVWLMIGIRRYSLGIINAGMLMMAALILARFLDSNISFVLKGIISIVIGIGFLATNVAVLRWKGGRP